MTRPTVTAVLIAAGLAVPLIPLSVPYWGAIGDVLAAIGWVPFVVFLLAWRVAGVVLRRYRDQPSHRPGP